MANRNLKIRVVSSQVKSEFEAMCDSMLKANAGKIAYQHPQAVIGVNGLVHVCYFMIEV